MTEFKIGQKVVCTTDFFERTWPLWAEAHGQEFYWPKKDQVYTIRDVITESQQQKVWREAERVLHFAEFTNPLIKGEEPGFGAQLFRALS